MRATLAKNPGPYCAGKTGPQAGREETSRFRSKLLVAHHQRIQHRLLICTWRHVLHLVADQLRHYANETGKFGIVSTHYDTELFGHWWFEGVDFVADLYRRLADHAGLRPRTASQHLRAHPPRAAVALGAGSWGANGDFSMWLNPGTRWTWERLWALDPSMKCLFLSGYTADVIARHGVLDEGVQFLPKPFTMKDLARRIREILRE